MISKVSGAERPQGAGEELANSISHGFALLLSLGALPVLIVNAVHVGGAASVVGASVFGTAMLLLYLTSTIYHALPAGKAKQVFRVLDHCAIFLMIAGTYTPFALGALSGVWGWSLFGVVWGFAVFGILTKTVFAARGHLLSTCLYLSMGWLVVVAAGPLFEAVPVAGLMWLLAGGLAYTLGVAFFLFDSQVRYAHLVWHLFVVTGSLCHFFAVLRYAA